MNCVFCDVGNKELERVIRDNKNTFVVLSNPRLMSGHMLVMPKRHVEKLSELSEEEREELFNQTIQLQEKVLETLAPGCDISQHYRPFIPNSRFKVSHLHIHVRPRTLDDELYQKVQSHEKDIFTDISEGDQVKYKKLFGN